MQQLQRRSFLQAAGDANGGLFVIEHNNLNKGGPPRHLHVWAYVGDKPGRLLIAFAPAGQMEAFFREVTKPNAAPMDAKTFRAYGMEHVGPPLSLL
jgi:hypothetical protein